MAFPLVTLSLVQMGAFLRIELFPSDLDQFLEFYTKVLRFTLVKHEHNYGYVRRDNIFIGAVSGHLDDGGRVECAFRRPPTGVEIVIEVDDVEKERDLVVASGWKLDADIKEQYWGLKDFRILDPEGYYLRITEHGQSRGA